MEDNQVTIELKMQTSPPGFSLRVFLFLLLSLLFFPITNGFLCGYFSGSSTLMSSQFNLQGTKDSLLAFSLKLTQHGPRAYARATHEDRRYIKMNQDREL